MPQLSSLQRPMGNKLVQTVMLVIGLLISNLSFGASCTGAEMINNSGNQGCDCCNIQKQGSDNNINTTQPINVLSGNKFRQEQDIKPQDISQTIGLEYTRYYNSQSNYANVLGYGWRSSYDIQLLDTNDGIQIIQSDGSQLFFYPTIKSLNNGLKQTIYTASNKKYGYITKTNNTGYPTWQWQYPSGQRLDFSTDSRYLKTNTTLGKLDRITSNSFQPNSDYLALRYDNHQRLIQVQDSRARQLTISYTKTRYDLPLITVQSPQAQYQYYLDKQGNLSQYINANGDRTAYYYQDPNDPHNLTKKVLYPALNPKQPQLLGQWQYDKNDRVIYESLADGKQAIRMQYDTNAPLNKVASLNEDGSKLYTNILTNALGQQTHYQYKILKGNYRTVKVEGAGCQSCGSTTLPTQLDEHGNLIEKVIGDNTYHYTYDGQSRLTRIDITTEEGNRQWLQSRQYQGDSIVPTVITEPSVIAGKQTTTTIRYNQYQQPVQVTQQGYIPATTNHAEQSIQRQISYAYGTVNGSSKLISIDSVLPGAADTITYQYNAQGQLIQINYPEGLTQRFNYDEAGRITRFQDIDTLTTDYLYDTQGQVIQTTKAGKISKVAYDAQGRLQQLVDPLGQTLNYQYNAAGELSQVSDGKLAQINLIRDIDGNLTQADLLVNGKVEQHINTPQQKNSSVLSFSDEPEPPLPTKVIKDKDRRDTVAYFDDFGRIVGEKSPTTGWTAYQWDNDDNLTQVTNELGQTITTTYDSYGRKILVQTNKEKISFNWNDKNQLTAINSNHYNIQYQYDDNNNLVVINWRLEDKKFSVQQKYDSKGNFIKKVLPSGIQLNYLYNQTGKLDKITREKLLFNSTIAFNLSDNNPYDYKSEFNLGNDLTQFNSFRKDGTVNFAGNKDIAYSQSQPYKDGYVIGYAYAGKSTQFVDTNLNNNQQDVKTVSQYPTNQDSYNAIGQLVKDNRYQYSYDEFGRLTEIYDLNHHLIAQYDHLITGERYKKTVFNNGKASQIIYYIYEDNLLIGEYTSNNKDKAKEYVYYGIQPVAMLENDHSYYLTTDHRDAVIAVTDDDKNIVWQGDIQANGFISSLKGSVEMNVRGSNQYYDAESGLHYNINRYFSPSRNQYLTPDPVGLAVGDDLYAFAFNRPHKFVDLDGLAPIEVYEDLVQKMPFLERAFIGSIVHYQLSTYLNNPLLIGWGGDNGRNGTFGIIRPDAYYVNKENRDLEVASKPFSGTIWELKPVSYQQDKIRRNKGIKQVNQYIARANSVTKGCWKAGDYMSIQANLKASILPTLFFNNKLFRITTLADVPQDIKNKTYSGLIFYKAVQVGNSTQASNIPDTVAEPNLSTQQKNQLQQLIDQIEAIAISQTGSQLFVKALLVALAALVAFFLARAVAAGIAQVFAALILLLTASVAMAKDGVVDENGNTQKPKLIDILSTAFGINLSFESIKEYANQKFNQVTQWVKGWFK